VSSDPFACFDWKYGLKKVDVVDGYHDASGNWVAEVTVETSISGHVSNLSQEELKFTDPILIESGVRKLATSQSYGLVVGDKVHVTEVDNSETEWLVYQKQSFSTLMDKYIKSKRETFLLRKII